MNKKILIVDDDSINRKLLKAILTKGGYQVIEANNGAEALEKLTPNVSLILLDLMMPVMDGLTFLRSYKSQKPQYANIPVLILTTDDSKKEEALRLGAKEVIIKPINPVEVIEKVSSYL
ncbi:MAG: response regulator [Nautiliaceae bacterium]